MTTLTRAERKALAEAALAAAEQSADVRLLTLDDLMLLDQTDLDQYMASLGVEVDWERLEDDTRRALGSEALALERGDPLTEARRERLMEASERAVVQTARDTANKIMGDMRLNAWQQADNRPEDQQFFMWVSVGTGCCKDCRSLHGVIFRMDYWDGHSPREGQTLCGARCRCSLVPCPSPGTGNEGTRSEEARQILSE